MFHGVPHNDHDVDVAPILDFHRHEPIMVFSQAADNQITQNPRAFRLIPTGNDRGLYVMLHSGFYPHHPHTRTMFEKDRPYAIINDKSGTALELSGPDYTSITVSEYHGENSQKVRSTVTPSLTCLLI